MVYVENHFRDYSIKTTRSKVVCLLSIIVDEKYILINHHGFIDLLEFGR